VNEIVQRALEAIQFVGDLFRSILSVLKTARIPPGQIAPAANQMIINYKAVAISMIFLFLARGLRGILVNDPSGSIIVVVIFVLMVVLLKYLSDFVTYLARLIGIGQLPSNNNPDSVRWSTLVVSMWTWSLFILVLDGFVVSYLGKNLSFFLGLSVFAVLVAALSFAIVCLKTRIIDKLGLGPPRQAAFHALTSIVVVATAIRVCALSSWT
jgi:hypothetical protein